jgi:hypothetical protein
MCPHDDFEILKYFDGMMARQCKRCKQVEIQTEYWINIDALSAFLLNMRLQEQTDE